MTYVLHKSVGEDIVIEHGGRAVRLADRRRTRGQHLSE